MKKSISRVRYEYLKHSLDEKKMSGSPFTEFSGWFKFALKKIGGHAVAMVLSTIGVGRQPKSRVMLLKDFSKNGFIFFSSYESQKAKEIKNNPKAAIVFFWPDLERQIRIEGKLTRTSRKVSASYFYSRPRGSQIAACISKQSAVIKGRKLLDKKYREFDEKYEGKRIPLPSDWGGYCLKPTRFEFWQGRENRLNDRVCYVKKSGRWTKKRLSP